jgi:hypothetical protein
VAFLRVFGTKTLVPDGASGAKKVPIWCQLGARSCQRCHTNECLFIYIGYSVGFILVPASEKRCQLVPAKKQKPLSLMR